MKWISSWHVYQGGLGAALESALECGEITADQEVWAGPDGSYAVVDSAADLDDTKYAEFTDTGETVSEIVGHYLYEERERMEEEVIGAAS